jgi:phage recombination protein Bet
MTTALATVVESAALAPVIPESKYALLRDTLCKGATDDEFDLFKLICNRLRLDPFAKQIYAVKRYDSTLRREVMAAQVSIDGMRLNAERTGKYGGTKDPEWCGEDGVWKDVWLSDKPPAAARVRVVRRDFIEPVGAIALYREYVQKTREGNPTKFWRDMPAGQLAKCAESLALRKAFPNEMSGVYSDVEMEQSDNDRPQLVANNQQPPKTAEPKQQSKPVGPVFWLGWPDNAWAGKLLTEAPANVLGDYIAFLDALIQDPTRERLHKGASASRDAAQKRFDELLDAETERALAKADEAAKAPADPITESMQAEHDRTHGAPAEDTNTSWGLEPQ